MKPTLGVLAALLFILFAAAEGVHAGVIRFSAKHLVMPAAQTSGHATKSAAKGAVKGGKVVAKTAYKIVW